MLFEDLKDYVNSWLGYEDEKRQLREAKNDFKNSFMARTGATKQEIQMLEKALSINKKLETDHEITDFVDKVEKIAEFLNKIAREETCGADEKPVLNHVPEQLEIDASLLPNAAETTKAAITLVTKKSEVVSSWNPPPAPVIPKVVSKKLKN